MEYKDYYQTLGIDKGASEKEIKSAFRKMARQYHPDVNPDDSRAEERFKEINEAYEVLSDPAKRQKYDQLGSAWQDWGRRGGGPGDFNWQQWTTGAPGQGQRVHVRYGSPEDLNGLFGGGGGGFSDFFAQIFGGMGRGTAGGPARGPAGAGYRYQAHPQRGADYEQEVEISLREAYQGTTRVLQKDGRRLEVKIPAGAQTGTRIRMAGEGGTGTVGGEAGDLYLRVKVMPDPEFERQGDDLYITVPVDLYTAVLGGKSRVPTLTGPVQLTIPAGTQNGRTFRLRGKGMPHIGESGAYGDLYAEVDVQIPTQLSPHQRALFEELREAV